jgi:hypothetical protein
VIAWIVDGAVLEGKRIFATTHLAKQIEGYGVWFTNVLRAAGAQLITIAPTTWLRQNIIISSARDKGRWHIYVTLGITHNMTIINDIMLMI